MDVKVWEGKGSYQNCLTTIFGDLLAQVENNSVRCTNEEYASKMINAVGRVVTCSGRVASHHIGV